MLEKWARLLPYWILIWAVRKGYGIDGIGKLIIGKEYDVKYYQLSEGEFIVFSKDIQDIFDKRKKDKQEKKLDKKLDKLNKQLNQDYWLKKELKEQFEDEKERDKNY